MSTYQAKWLLACALLLSCSWAFSQADTVQELLTCASVKPQANRLSCYDTLARASAPNEVETIGSWVVRTGVDPINGSKNVYLSTTASSGTTEASGNPQALWLRCLQGEIRTFITWQVFLGTGTIETTYKIGTADSTTDTWYIGADGRAVFYSYNESAILDFISKLVESDDGTLTALITSSDQITHMATFNISGLGELVNRIYRPCGKTSTR